MNSNPLILCPPHQDKPTTNWFNISGSWYIFTLDTRSTNIDNEGSSCCLRIESVTNTSLSVDLNSLMDYWKQLVMVLPLSSQFFEKVGQQRDETVWNEYIESNNQYQDLESSLLMWVIDILWLWLDSFNSMS